MSASRVISYMPSTGNSFNTLNFPTEGDGDTSLEQRLSVEFEDEKSFEDIRTEYLSKKSLYEDHRFPAVDTSLYFSTTPPYTIDWLRPSVCQQSYYNNLKRVISWRCIKIKLCVTCL